MPTPSSEIGSRRLDLAGTRDFHVPGAGQGRRASLSAFNRDWLGQVWREATGGARLEGVALAAVGSVARGDAGPLSDYDLVLVHSERSLPAKELTSLADRIWYPIWDAGVRLDHSVRTVTQCRQVAAADLTAAVGLLDLTALAGDAELVAAARATVAHDWRGNARRRLPQLLDAVAARHQRHGELAQSIEPDLKEAHGGLRDMSVLRALTEAWLADKPHGGGVDTASGLLLDVRDAVHVVTGRSRDLLGREDQDAVAALLGHADADDLLTAVSGAGRSIAYALDGTLRRAGQSQRARTLRVGPRRPQMTPMGHGLFSSDGEVVLGAARLAEADAALPLRAAIVAARAGLPIAPATLDNLARNAPVLVQPWPRGPRSLLGDVLACGPGLVAVWEGLDQVGIIDGWLPEWSDVRSRPQRSAVHRHTVDRHLLETVVRASGLVRRVARPDLLLVAALLHDIGKVRGAHDHSIEGARRTETIVQRWGMPQGDVTTLVTLVREHLTLIELATRRDHQDPATIDAAVAAVNGDREVFELLLALTEADAAAAGPVAWTDWRATLLDQLAARVRDRFNAPTPAVADERGPVREDPSRLDPEVVAAVRGGEPSVRVIPAGGTHRLDVTDVDRVGLFADTAGLLAAEGLTVRTAILHTVGGIAVDEWHVESPGGGEPDPERISRGLARLARGDRAPLSALDRRRAHLPRPSGRAGTGSPGRSRALVVPGASLEATVLEVRAEDRPGLLHDLGAALARAGISVRSAHIATYAGQTLDTFYLTGADGLALPPARVAQAVGLVIDTCDGLAT